MKKQKFRGMYTIVTLSFVLGLTACQATPEEDVIVQKAELAEKLTQAAENEAGEDRKMLREQLGVPETISFHLSSEDGKRTFIAEDAPILVPETDRAGTAVMKRADFTDGDTETWTKLFFGENQVWKREEYVMTKADWLAAIEDYKNWMEEMKSDPKYGFTEDDEVWMQEELNNYVAQMEAAPEEAPAPKHEAVEYRLIPKEDEDKGTYSMYEISGVTRNGEGTMVITNTEGNGNSGNFSDHTGRSSGEESAMKEYTVDTSWQDRKTEIPNICQYSEEEAIAMVKEVLDSLQPGNHLEVSQIQPLYHPEQDKETKEEKQPEEYVGYAIRFSRSLGDLIENDTNYDGIGVEIVCTPDGKVEQLTAADYEPFGYENIIAYVTSDGIDGFSWMNRMEEGEVLQENVALLPFEKIQKILEEQLPMNLVGCGDQITRRVSRIQLGLMAVRTPDQNDSFTLLPVWDVYSIWESEDAEWEYEDNTLTINAIDGSIIDRNYRY